jgi:formylglycine-generating enzyme required for sulfatase activity
MGRCGAQGAGCSDAFGGWDGELPEHDATVASFFLDTFEVTVGRFRKFVEQYDGTFPDAGAGAHPFIPNSGWQSAWDASLPSSHDAFIVNLKCSAGNQTWTDESGSNELYPINCVSWYEAFAFCIWDGGRLPTEAEWEYAAAGGKENRLFPWGSQDPAGPPQRANFSDTANSPFIDVGSYPAGAGRFSQYDLAGSIWEWVLDWYTSDWYSGAGNTCDNCVNFTGASARILRGGQYSSSGTTLRAASRSFDAPSVHNYVFGFRCARMRLQYGSASASASGGQ